MLMSRFSLKKLIIGAIIILNASNVPDRFGPDERSLTKSNKMCAAELTLCSAFKSTKK